MAIGIDIGSKTIKLVELHKDGKGYGLKAAGVIGYSGEPIEKLADEKSLVALSDAIRKLYKDSKASSKNSILSIPEPQVFTRTIKLPMLTDQEISSAIKWEAEQYIPIPAKDAIIQHEIIEKNESASPPYVKILLIAAPTNVAQKYVKVANMAKLNPVAIETELAAITRALAPADKSVVLINSGHRSTDLAIAENGNLSFVRSIPTAGAAFTRAIARSLGINEQQAAEYKRTYGFASDQLEGKVEQALDPVFRVVIEEIRKAIHYYQTEEKSGSIEYVILSGGTAGMPDISTKLTKLLNYEVIIGNPFANIKIDPEVAKNLMPYSPLYSVAVGLAMRDK